MLLTLYSLSFDLLCINDKDGVYLHGHVNVTKEAAQELSKGMSTIGSQLGLGGTMVGLATAVGKVIAKSGMPPRFFQKKKAGIVVGGAVLSGYAHSSISSINRNNIKLENNESVTNENIGSNISKFIDDSSYSPLETLLSNLEGISITCLSLISILIIQIIYKLYLKHNIKLNFSNILGISNNSKLEYYVNKIISLNKKMSTIYISLIIIFVMVGLCVSTYVSSELLNNIDNYIIVHNNIKK